MTGKKILAFLSVLIVAAILVVLNYIVGGLGVGNARIDLTEKKIYTLSGGSREILNSIPDGRKVSIRFYDTKDSRVMPSQLETHARNVRDLLREFVAASHGKVVLEEFDPATDNDDEDKARDDEMQPVPVSKSESVYLGLAVQSLQKKEILPFLNPTEETRLEYELARAIRKVLSDKRPVVGVMSSLPVAGPPFVMPGSSPQLPWAFHQVLQRDYDVRKVEENAEKIDPDISVLVVVHPAGFSERTEYAIDQYLLHGGNLIVFADAYSFMAKQSAPANPMMMRQAGIPVSSSLTKLFPNWGVSVLPDEVLVDQKYVGEFGPAAPFLPQEAMNHDDLITANLENVMFPLSGSVTLRDVRDLKHTVLMSSSDVSETMGGEAVLSQLQSGGKFTNFISDGKAKPLVVRVTGVFHTAFPKGRPAAPPPQPQGAPGGLPSFGETGGAAPGDAEAESEAPEPVDSVPVPAKDGAEKPDPDFIDTAVNKNSQVIVVADSDLLADNFCVQQVMGGFMLPNNNLPFLGNMVEQLSGGSMLAAVRSRSSAVRPFTLIQEREATIRALYDSKLAQAEQDIQDLQQKIGSVQIKAEDGQVKFILTPEQQKQVEDLKGKLKAAEKSERELNKKQRAEVDSMKTFIKLMNVALVPFLVVVLGVLVFVFRSFAVRAR